MFAAWCVYISGKHPNARFNCSAMDITWKSWKYGDFDTKIEWNKGYTYDPFFARNFRTAQLKKDGIHESNIRDYSLVDPNGLVTEYSD